MNFDPTLANADSDALLSAVAAGQSAGGDVTHPTRMLSLSKISPDQDGSEVNRSEAAGLATKTKFGVVVEPKMDGLAVRVEYR
ncbi:MAG: hypothetical protein ACSLEW_08880 [Nocardioides sp.]